MPISAARRIAYDVLLRVETQQAYASDLLHSALTGKISAADAGLTTELALGVLRQQRLLDFLIERQSRKRIAGLDREVVLALRLGLYQLRFLDRVPARAAIYESVELVKQGRKKSAATFVNAVLRRASATARADFAPLLPANFPLAERLGILHSHPTWLVERWLGRFGETQAIALLEANNRAPELAGVIHDASARDEIVRSMERSGLHILPGLWLKDAFRASGGSLAQSAEFREGRASIQDEASQMVPLLLDVARGDSVLDLCAAPGGKTATLARAAGPDAVVVAADRHAHRLGAIKKHIERLRLRGVEIVELDGTLALPFLAKFARVLVDAPCSGTGTLGRNPEIRWSLRVEDLGALHERQVALLRAGLGQLEAGGRLVYSTCSLEAEENEGVIEAALGGVNGYRRVGRDESMAILAPHFADDGGARGLAKDARLNPGATQSLPVTSFFDEAGAFRALPSVHHTDGFFAVAIERDRPS
ncbi:MAG: 16S rRNA (cytosine(967)-C(5))-methyltransferase RsmB [Candidatus Acidiferrales bacterium]